MVIAELTASADEYNSNLIEKEAEIEHLSEQLDVLKDEKKNQQMTIDEVGKELNSIKVEKEHMNRTLLELKKEHEASLEELNAQHEESLQELIKYRDTLDEANKSLKLEVSHLRDQIENRSKDDLVELDLSRKLQASEGLIIKLKDEINENNKKLETGAIALNELHMEKQELENEVKNIQVQLKDSNERLSKMSQRSRQLEEQTEKEKVAAVSFPNEATALEPNLEAALPSSSSVTHEFQNQIVFLEGELEATKKKLDDVVNQHEITLTDMKNNEANNANKLQAQQEALTKLCQEKEERLRDLEEEATGLKSEIIDKEKKLVVLNEAQGRLAETNQVLSEARDQLNAKVEELEGKCERLVEVETQYERSKEECKELYSEVERLNDAMSSMKSSNHSATTETSKSDALAALEEEISVLKKEATANNSQIKTYQDEIRCLHKEIDQKTVSLNALLDKEKNVNSMEVTIQSQRGEIMQLHETLKETETSLNKAKVEIKNLSEEVELSKMPNEDQAIVSSSNEIDEIQLIVSEKDNIISELRSSNDALLKLLEERSLHIHGDKSLLDFHKLENEAKGLKMEREQIMSVLNEKSRECSSLKSEVHRLMNVISAEKAALSKLTQENQDLMTKNNHEDKEDSPNQEMTKEAVKKLSQIIRDKDLEIESLSQKNETLLQVLQQGGTPGDAGAHLSTLMQEKENLLKQVALFQKDREQLITALNQKHQEVLLYHQELQKLTAVRNGEVAEQEKLQQEFSTLQFQYEDKQKQLLKSQNDLLNYKQKYAEAEEKYDELLKNQLEYPEHVAVKTVETNLENNNRSSQMRDSPFRVIKEEIPLETVESLLGKQQTDSPRISPTVLDGKNKEIEGLKSQLKKLKENEKVLRDMKDAIQTKENLIHQRDNTIISKDKTISELNARVHRSEEIISHRDTEIHTIKKQQENLIFQLEGLQTEFHDAIRDRDQLQGHVSGLSSEVALLKETKSKLSMDLSEKELELNGLREKVRISFCHDELKH